MNTVGAAPAHGPAGGAARHGTPGRGGGIARLAVAGIVLGLVVAACASASALPGSPAMAAAPPVDGPAPSATPAAPIPSLSATPAASARAPFVRPSAVPSAEPGSPSASPAPAPTPVPAPVAGVVLDVPVLMYHRVAPAAEIGHSLPGLVVSPDLFAAQMEAFKHAGWTTITAADLAADLAAGRTPPRHTFVVTFDDGHEDGYTHAFPVLQRLGYVATYYVITGRIGRTGNLTAAELRAMAAAGMEIGSHTVSHAFLPRESSRAARAQLARSARDIAATIGTAPTTFAYPYGAWSGPAEADVAATGYGLAFTEQPGCALTWTTRFSAPRLRVSAGTPPAVVLGDAAACNG